MRSCLGRTSNRIEASRGLSSYLSFWTLIRWAILQTCKAWSRLRFNSTQRPFEPAPTSSNSSKASFSLNLDRCRSCTGIGRSSMTDSMAKALYMKQEDQPASLRTRRLVPKALLALKPEDAVGNNLDDAAERCIPAQPYL